MESGAQSTRQRESNSRCAAFLASAPPVSKRQAIPCLPHSSKKSASSSAGWALTEQHKFRFFPEIFPGQSQIFHIARLPCAGRRQRRIDGVFKPFWGGDHKTFHIYDSIPPSPDLSTRKSASQRRWERCVSTIDAYQTFKKFQMQESSLLAALPIDACQPPPRVFKGISQLHFLRCAAHTKNPVFRIYIGKHTAGGAP